MAPAESPSGPSTLLTALAPGFCRTLRIILEITTAGLPAFSTGFRCALRIFSKIAFTTSTLSHVPESPIELNIQVQGTCMIGEPGAAEVRVIFTQAVYPPGHITMANQWRILLSNILSSDCQRVSANE